MKNFIIATAALVAVSFVAADTAEAGHRRHGRSGVNVAFGGNGWSVSLGSRHRGHHGRYGYYGHPRIRPGYGYGCRAPVYRRMGHWDYHPTQVIPHGNHFDVIPGHYDYHDTSRRNRRGGHGRY